MIPHMKHSTLISQTTPIWRHAIRDFRINHPASTLKRWNTGWKQWSITVTVCRNWSFHLLYVLPKSWHICKPFFSSNSGPLDWNFMHISPIFKVLVAFIFSTWIKLLKNTMINLHFPFFKISFYLKLTSPKFFIPLIKETIIDYYIAAIAEAILGSSLSIKNQQPILPTITSIKYDDINNKHQLKKQGRQNFNVVWWMPTSMDSTTIFLFLRRKRMQEIYNERYRMFVD